MNFDKNLIDSLPFVGSSIFTTSDRPVGDTKRSSEFAKAMQSPAMDTATRLIDVCATAPQLIDSTSYQYRGRLQGYDRCTSTSLRHPSVVDMKELGRNALFKQDDSKPLIGNILSEARYQRIENRMLRRRC